MHKLVEPILCFMPGKMPDAALLVSAVGSAVLLFFRPTAESAPRAADVALVVAALQELREHKTMVVKSKS